MSDADDSEIEGFLSGHKPFENPPTCLGGTCVGDWKILAFLGRGGSSEVYRAENTVTGQVAALKVLARTDGKTRERFKREVRLVAETQNAAFPKFYGAGEDNDRLYIAEELLEPVVLPSRDAEVARFILNVAAGLAELHRLGFIHRDIKPRNVMVRPLTGESVLIDLGLAKEEAGTPQARDDTLSVVDGRAVGVGTSGIRLSPSSHGRSAAVMPSVGGLWLFSQLLRRSLSRFFYCSITTPWRRNRKTT